MANHGFVTTKKNLTTAMLKTMLDEINHDRFNRKLVITSRGETVIVMLDEITEIPFWLASKRKIETRHSFRGDMGWWVSSVFINDLALKIDGTISDEGVEERWKGEPNKYPTLKSWLDTLYNTRFMKAIALWDARRYRHLRGFIK